MNKKVVKVPDISGRFFYKEYRMKAEYGISDCETIGGF